MVAQNELAEARLAELARRCMEESDNFFSRRPYDASFCFELFRRAFEERDQGAWQILFRQYRPLVASWVERQQAFRSSGEEIDYFVNGSFARLMKAIPPAAFVRFQNLSAILGYLQLCVASEVNDYMRSLRGPETLPLDQINLAAHLAPDDVELTAQVSAERSALWQLVRSCTSDETELLVVYASYVLGLKPRQLFEQYPDRFADISRVYRIKENVLARLKRDHRIQAFLENES